MAESFPHDRFDEVPDLKRVGAHRAPAPKGRGWIAFLVAVVATLVLVGIGTFALFSLNDRIDFFGGAASPSPTPTPTPTPTEAAPVVDPAASILVLNGTPTSGLAAAGAAAITAAGFPQQISTSDASTDDVATSGVYYQDASQEGAARAIAAALGGIPIQLTDQYVIPVEEGQEPILRIVVVLGADYQPAV